MAPPMMPYSWVRLLLKSFARACCFRLHSLPSKSLHAAAVLGAATYKVLACSEAR